MSTVLRLRVLTALLLGASAVTFTAGTNAERSGHHQSAAQRAAEGGGSLPPAPTSVPPPAPDSPSPNPTAAGSDLSAPEGSAAREAAERGEVTPHAANGDEAGEAGERVFGFNPESRQLIAVADAASVLLMLLVLFAPTGILLVGTAAATIAFTAAAGALDLREMVRQHDRGAIGPATTAAAVAVLHLLCTGAATALLRLRQVRGGPAGTPPRTTRP